MIVPYTDEHTLFLFGITPGHNTYRNSDIAHVVNRGMTNESGRFFGRNWGEWAAAGVICRGGWSACAWLPSTEAHGVV